MNHLVTCEFKDYAVIISATPLLIILNLVLDTITVAIVGLIIYAAVTYLPGHIIMMVHFLYGAITEGEAT